MQHNYNDGGRAAAGYKGETRDCVTRAIAIATGKPYKEVYSAINAISGATKTRGKSSARAGVQKAVWKKYLSELGWKWTPTMAVGQGCKTHLRADELPSGKIIVSVSHHLCTVIDGVIQDTFDPSRNGTRCVYGYYIR
jgi:hypothetical protein